MQEVVGGQHHSYSDVLPSPELLRPALDVGHGSGGRKYLFGVDIYGHFLCLHEGTVGLPQGLVPEQNEIVIHVKSVQKYHVLQGSTEISQHPIEPLLPRR